METFEKLEHHAYLTVDELSGLSELFTRNVHKMVVDLRGRTTVAKNKSKLNDLGIKKLSHTYLDVVKNDLEINNESELKTIIEDYDKEGVTNLYITRLIVVWNNGDMQEWHRHVMHVKDKETSRSIPSQRGNTLTMKIGTYDGVQKLQEIYGTDMVKSTICEIVNVDKPLKRVCLSSVAETG